MPSLFAVTSINFTGVEQSKSRDAKSMYWISEFFTVL